MPSTPEPGQEEELEQEQSESPEIIAQPVVNCSPSLIASLEEALLTLRNPEPDTEKHGVEVGIVACFLYNLQEKHEEEYKFKVVGLVRQLRALKHNVEDDMILVRRGLPYQGNDPRLVLASMNRQNARR